MFARSRWKCLLSFVTLFFFFDSRRWRSFAWNKFLDNEFEHRTSKFIKIWFSNDNMGRTDDMHVCFFEDDWEGNRRRGKDGDRKKRNKWGNRKLMSCKISIKQNAIFEFDVAQWLRLSYGFYIISACSNDFDPIKQIDNSRLRRFIFEVLLHKHWTKIISYLRQTFFLSLSFCFSSFPSMVLVDSFSLEKMWADGIVNILRTKKNFYKIPSSWLHIIGWHRTNRTREKKIVFQLQFHK